MIDEDSFLFTGILLLVSKSSEIIFANHNFNSLPFKNSALSQESLRKLCSESLLTGKQASLEINTESEPPKYFRLEVLSVSKGVILVGVDITTLKKQEEKLQRNKYFVERNHQHELLGIWEWDLENEKNFWSESLYQMFGISKGNTPPSLESYLCLLHPDDVERVRNTLSEAVEKQQKISFDQRVIHPDGSIHMVHSWGCPILENDKPIGYVGICLDVTNRVLNDEKIRNQEQVYEKMFENFEEGLWIIDEKNITTLVNRKMEEMLGYLPGEMLSRSLYDFMDEEGIQITEKNLARRRMGINEQHEFVLRHKDGSKVWTLMGSSPLTKRDGSYNGAMAIVYDVTDRKRKEVLLQAQKNIFEILTHQGSLSLALTELVRGIESLIEGVHASILILHEDGRKLLTGAAPSLPAEYNEAINGVEIGPAVGSCGTSAFKKQTIIVSDIMSDPLWVNYKDLADKFGYKACWSTPILDDSVLGTFALYLKEKRSPTESELKLVNDFTSAARLSIDYVKARTKEKKLSHYSSLLSNCRKALSESLEFKKVLKKIPGIITSDFADWCFVTIMTEEGYLEVLSSSSIPEKEELLKELEFYRPDMAAKHGLPLAIREKKAILYSEVTEDDLIPGEDGWPIFGTRDPQYLAIIKQLGFKSMIVAPMIVRGVALGGLTIVSSTIDKRFSKDDLHLIEDIAQSCAIAMDNALLYSDSQQSVKVREDFISIASHELRSPLTSLKLRVDLLTLMIEKEYFPKDIIEKLKPVVSEIQPDLAKFSRLIEALLDISKLSAKKLFLNIQPCDVTEVLNSEINRTRTNSEAQLCEIKTSIQDQLMGFCDPLRLQQVVSNLLSNAVKFGNQKPVEFIATRKGNDLVIKVIDHGIGISETDLKRIFKPFERAVSEKNFGGLGLGLYITDQIVKGHGGKLSATSNQKDGTCFTVELPIFTKG